MRSACRLLAIPVFATLGTAGCSNTAIVDVSAGPFDYTVSASQATIPSQFVDASTNTIATISCSVDSDCPQLGTGEPAVHCVASACVPDPFAFVLVSDVIDLNSNATVAMYGDNVTVLDITGVSYDVTDDGLLDTVGPTTLYWGPESAADITSAGVVMLGTIAAFTLAEGQTLTAQQVALDSDGAAQLSSYVLDTSRRFKLLARPTISVMPGGPLPSGDVTIALTLSLHIEGTLVR